MQCHSDIILRTGWNGSSLRRICILQDAQHLRESAGVDTISPKSPIYYHRRRRRRRQYRHDSLPQPPRCCCP